MHLILSSPVGWLRLEGDGSAITRLCFADGPADSHADALLLEARRQLEEYFSGSRRAFQLPLAPVGTAFQLAVWQALQAIPYGQCVSYGHIARSLGRPGAARAVGGAVGRNPLPILLPCHRVIGAGGQLTGFSGGMDKKIHLLRLEGYQI